MVKVSVIIVNYNGKRFLKDCLESLVKQSFKDFEVLVADNGSKDGSIEYIKSLKNKPKKLKIFPLEFNRGFAGGNNAVYDKTKGKYVMLLNNDTILDKDCLKILVKTAEENKNAAIVASLSFPFGTNLKKIKLENADKTALSIVFTDLLLKEKKASLYVDPAAALVRKKFFPSLFDEDYFCYGEDVYLCWLANIRGYDTIYSNAKFLHFGSGTTQDSSVHGKNKPSVFVIYYIERNLLINFFVFYSNFNIVKLLPLVFISRVFRLGSKVLKFDSDRTKASLKAYLWVFLNFFKILSKRSRIQRLREKRDEELLKMMSYRIFEDKHNRSPLIELLNKLSFIYTRILGIKTMESI